MNLPDLLSELNIPHRQGGEHHHVRHGWIGLDCPWCGRNSQGYHLGIRLDDLFTTCWRCGPHWLGNVLSDYTNQPWSVVRGWIDSLAPSHRLTQADTEQFRHKRKIDLPKGIEGLREPHRAYLRKRGFDPDEIANKWGVRGIGMASTLSWRLFIPIYLHRATVSWTTRGIGDKSARYLTAKPEQEVMHHRNVLYGADYTNDSVVVCEGPLDAWAIGLGGVATLGLQFSQTHVTEIGGFARRTICYDSTISAQQQANKLARLLESFPGETNVVRLESGDDPADAKKNELDKLRKQYLN